MGQGKLENGKVAILSEDGFEQTELLNPKEALERAAAEVFVVRPRSGFIGTRH